MPKFRHEIKLLLTQADYRLMSARLSALLMHDENAGEDGEYFIRSLYFDDASHMAYREKLSGVADRKKIPPSDIQPFRFGDKAGM